MPRWRKRLVIVAAVTVVLAASGFAYFRHLYPYGRSHCCDRDWFNQYPVLLPLPARIADYAFQIAARGFL